MKDLQKNISHTISCPFLFAFAPASNNAVAKQSYCAILQNRDIDKSTDAVSCTLVNLDYPDEVWNDSTSPSDGKWKNENTMVVFKFADDALDCFDDREKVGMYIYKEVTTGTGDNATTERKEVWWNANYGRIRENMIGNGDDTSSEQ